MKNRPRVNKPTKDKLVWLKDNYNNYEYKEDLIEDMSKIFGVHTKNIRAVLKVFNGEKTNTSTYIKKSNDKAKKKIEKKCYFCAKSSNLIQHHISYHSPEKKICLCKSCHIKLHHIIKEQHLINKNNSMKLGAVKVELDRIGRTI